MNKSLSALAIASIALLAASGAQAEAVRTERNMSLELATRIATAAVAACQEKGYAVTTTVVDRAGTVRAVLRDVLGLSAERVAAFDADTPLFGALPELDSMAVAGVLTELEDRLGMLIDDDEVDGEMLETFGGLTAFAAGKVAG